MREDAATIRVGTGAGEGDERGPLTRAAKWDDEVHRPMLHRPSDMPCRLSRPARARGSAFTLVELIVVIVLLSLLSGFVMQKTIVYTAEAKESSDRASISAIKSALSYAFVDHRLRNVAAGSWVNAVTDIAATMDPPVLPNGITVSGAQLVDQRGNFYDFFPESASGAARVQLAAGSPGP